ncbi:MAG: DNA polymerase III subunit alpha, partial [Candidatus Edwardsbacteria bacterium]|nr:DNA polymerase III subunit alpha [Candidatus Edwardsbacteria bacterium]
LHSHYSLLDGLSKVPDLVAKAKEQGAKALALTDHGVMYGAIEFYNECKKQGIKPIVGNEVYITRGKLTDRELKRGEKNYYHLTLLAKDHEGYVNLMKLTTKAHLEGFYYRPRIDHETLKEHARGLVCMSGCLNGELHRTILEGNLDEAKKIALWHKGVFGDDYYLELQYHPNIPEQQKVNDTLITLSQELNIPLVVTTDAHYLNADDQEAHEVLLCIQTGSQITDEKRFSMKGEIFDVKDPQEIMDAFKHVPEAITNTVKIADKCNLKIPMGKIIFPLFRLPEGETLESLFDKQIETGLQKRFPDGINSEVRERAAYEKSVIRQMEYENFFLIVADFVNWAKDKGILIGPGRGSGASSIVAYALGITNVDPIKHKLLFERFLNPDRISPPDFDIDFPDDRRHEVIEYVTEKYGRSRVANIITFGTMASRAAVRDTGRALGMSYGEVDRIAKVIPPPQQGKHTPLAKHIENVAELREAYDSNPAVKRLLDLSQKLEGTIRHASTHAAGVVIGDKDLVNYAPLQYSPTGDKVITTQYSMYPIEDLGLLKIDFLGLKNLTIIKNVMRIVRKTKDVEIDLDKIPFDDEKVFELLRAGNTSGVFQLEGEGMTRYVKELQPTVFNDISAIIALFRPGPIELIPEFIARKHGRKKIEYLHPKLEPILNDTYGIAVFQEQVLQIARDLCGFTLGEADVLRKAIGKKIPKLLAEQKDKFLKGAISNGISQDIAEKLFHFVEPFALYGFNRAHTTSYAIISYWTAYLKAYFPNAFMAALMTSDQHDLDKIAQYISECEKMGLKVVPPSVNKSFTDFAVVRETGEIVFGLNVIKNVGRKVSDMIEEERKANGDYVDLVDFVKRAGRDVINRKTLESLILGGALDSLEDRKVLIESLDGILSFASDYYRRLDSTQEELFGEAEVGGSDEIKLVATETATDQEKLAWEREYLGTFVSHHPLKDMMSKLEGKVRQIGQLSNMDDNISAKIAGIVTRVQQVLTKQGTPMLFVTLQDLSGMAEVVVFPKVLEKTKDMWIRDKVLVVSGKVNIKETAENQGDEIVIVTEPKLLATTAMEVNDVSVSQIEQMEQTNDLRSDVPPVPVLEAQPTKKFEYIRDVLFIRLPRNFTNGKLDDLKKVLDQHPGEFSVVLELFSRGQWQTVKTGAKSGRSGDLDKELSNILT